MLLILFFFNDTATTEIYTLSLHDALPIYVIAADVIQHGVVGNLEDIVLQFLQAVNTQYLLMGCGVTEDEVAETDRKSTRLNSSHANISYAVFCLKKKKHTNNKYNLLSQRY